MAKYIKTKGGDIIVFSEAMFHNEFQSKNPVSAGFIKFYVNKEGEMDCRCYGQSVSLGLASDEEDDTTAARFQLLNLY